MKIPTIIPLGSLLVLQYVALSITIAVYHPHVYFPGIRIVALLALLVTDVLGYILWRSLIRPQFSVLRDLPQPSTRGGLLTGHVGAVFSIPLGRQVADWVNNIPNNGLVWFRGMLGAEYLIVAGAESLRDVLFARAYDFEKTSAFRRYTRRFMAAGLVTHEGDSHKRRRRAIAPVFQPRNVDALKPMLSEKSERLIQALSRKAAWDQGSASQTNDGTVIDICDWATRFALDVACVVGFGDDWGLVETPEVKPILAAYQTIFTGSKTKMSQYAWHNTAPRWLVDAFPHQLDKSMDEAARTVNAISLQAVMKRVQKLERGEKCPQDFLTEVIQSKKFTPQECSDELLILMAAAHESTAALIAMTVYQLTQNPQLQAQLREELAFFGLRAGSAPINESQYEHMTLLNAVLSEMMRLEPPLPITLRKTVRNTSIAGHPVRAGTYVIISPYAMGRSQDIWGPTASHFNPHRWIDPPAATINSEKPATAAAAAADDASPPFGTLNEHGGAANHYGMLTFLKGPKGCTGERFAKAELRRVIASLVANFEWTLEQSHRPEQVGIVVVKPENGISVRFRAVSTPEPEMEGENEKGDLLL
ncbi:uncharacterized protein HMPREF1541_05914 [Cyphellophora europaea CBS 101466]|uniref:Cytochrome P450 monooxygenase n=1 Tax=Cyphellophora europaea (strain CBS 101466) TaxID=1220924 RepID=W2RV83_CYPE1|nr:uncharacterized protein HMPREF1541_05914 [Cyphellophora europaea CBS 101466]ETN39688.1 hypothetical protein HMPREF1541_05914 [Cyphellophora europaea CBS 101466]